MKAAPAPRWALSLADLALLLLGFFILLHVNAAERSRVADSIRDAFGAETPDPAARLDAAAARLFEPGEAVLTPSARKRLQAIGSRAAEAGERVAIQSVGKDPATQRFDGWELAAARIAAAAREIEAGGVAEDEIDIAMPSSRNEQQPGGHKILVRVVR